MREYSQMSQAADFTEPQGNPRVELEHPEASSLRTTETSFFHVLPLARHWGLEVLPSALTRSLLTHSTCRLGKKTVLKSDSLQIKFLELGAIDQRFLEAFGFSTKPQVLNLWAKTPLGVSKDSFIKVK